MVKVYGGKMGIAAVLSKMCSPGTSQKFDDATAELANLAKQVVGLTQQQRGCNARVVGLAQSQLAAR